MGIMKEESISARWKNQPLRQGLRKSVARANQDPYGEGWFVKFEVGDFESDKENLLSPEGYFEVLNRKIEIERQKLKK